MPKKSKTIIKTFRFPVKVCRWLEKKRVNSGRSQTWILLDALAHKYPEVQDEKP